MAQRSTAEPTRASAGAAPAPQPANPFRFVGVKIHLRDSDHLKRIEAFLIEKAEQGSPIPIRFDLGMAHLVHVAVDKLGKELGVP